MTNPIAAHPSHSPRGLFAIAASLLAVSIAVTSDVRADQTAQTGAAKGASTQSDDELARVGEELVTKVCTSACHGAEKLDEMRRTRSDWNTQVGDMASKGATATDAQFATIKKYLARYYGFVAVNTATAEDLSAVVGFSAKDAEAIVAYRAANGKFADAAALAKVPGIDKSKIEDQPDALRFR